MRKCCKKVNIFWIQTTLSSRASWSLTFLYVSMLPGALVALLWTLKCPITAWKNDKLGVSALPSFFPSFLPSLLPRELSFLHIQGTKTSLIKIHQLKWLKTQPDVPQHIVIYVPWAHFIIEEISQFGFQMENAPLATHGTQGVLAVNQYQGE